MARSTQTESAHEDICTDEIPLQDDIGVLPYHCRGPFAYAMHARRRHDCEEFDVVIVDPDACLMHGAAVVAQFRGGPPFVTTLERTGRDSEGRFVTLGDPREAVRFGFGVTHVLGTLLDAIRILGRVVEKPHRPPSITLPRGGAS